MIKKLIIKYGGEWIFLGVVLSIFLIVTLINVEIAINSLVEFKKLSYQVFPVLILVFALIFIAQLFLTKNRVLQYLRSSNMYKKYFFSIVLGIISSGPIYMWYPLLSDLKEKGVSDDILAIFLYNRAVKIPLMPMIIYYFGVPFLVVVSLLMIFFSVINGLIVNKFTK